MFKLLWDMAVDPKAEDCGKGLHWIMQQLKEI